MTPNNIFELVQKGADARMGDTIERLLFILRNKHTHECPKRTCDCEYCRFIMGNYTPQKLILHRIKKRINQIENHSWDASDYELHLLWQLQADFWKKKSQIKELKEHKKDLKEIII
jgi:hypothetical protein